MIISDFNFDGSTVTDFKIEKESIILKVEDVQHDNKKKDVVIEFKQVSKLTVNNDPEVKVKKMLDDGEILSIGEDNGSISILIEWNKYGSKLTKSCLYDFKCRNITLVQETLSQTFIEDGIE